MKRIHTKKWRVILTSAVLILGGYAIVKACAGGDWEDGDGSNMAPEAFVDSAYRPFFYSDMFYYDINYDNAHDQRFNETNVAEWQSFLGKEISRQTIQFLLITADYNTIKGTYNFYQGKGNVPDAMKPYASNLHSGSAKEKAFLQYLTIAKACESFATNGVRNSWEYDEAKKPSPPPDNINANMIETLMQQASEPFLKERYWFQLVRFNFFNSIPDCITAFESNKKNFSNSVMYYRTMAYAAGAYYKQKNYSKANYYYSLVFAGNDALKTVAHYSFHPQEEKDWQQTLALCANNKERITLWQMLGVFYQDEMRSMQEIYKLDAGSPTLDLLAMRKINELETGNSKPQEINEAFAWYKKVTDENKESNPFLWNISTGYLAYMKNDFTTARQYFAAAEKKMPNTLLAKDQVRLMQLLNKVESLKTIAASDEQAILPDFEWLYGMTDSIAPHYFRYYAAAGSIKTSMAKKYAAQGDLVKSECFVTNTNFYIVPKNVEALKAYLTAANPSKFDLLCRKFSAKQIGDLWEYQAVQATFKDDLDNAITLMTKAGKNANKELLGNPFNGKIQDCHDCDHAQKQKVKYNKLSFLQKMKELKANVEAKNDVYNNALLLANGYYNITHFGNARYFYEGEVLGSGQSDPYAIDSVFKPMLTDNSLATKYYRLALQSATDDEQKAKCLYMISKCERNEWYNKTFFNDPKNNPEWGNNTNVDFITWNAFSALRKYKNTQYYRDVIQECGYFKTAMAK